MPGAGPVAVVSHRLWRAHLGAREDAVGGRLLINRIPVTVVGVMPPDRDLILGFEPLGQHVDDALAGERVLAAVAGFFGAVALLLVGLGLYGVAANAVARRRMEFGIRLAVGATPAALERMVLSRLSILFGAGAVAGAVLGVWTTTLVASWLYGLEPHDPGTLAGSAAVLAVVAALASWLPVRRASRLDPATLLRAR
jgi:hypothetical protein